MQQRKLFSQFNQIEGQIQEVNQAKGIYNQYFQDLQHKLIHKSNKISTLIGGSYLSKLSKAQSLDQEYSERQNHIDFVAPKSQKQHTYHSRVQKHSGKSFQKYIEPIVESPSKYRTPSQAIQRLRQIKVNLIERAKNKNSYNRFSSSSGGNNTRKLAYNYNFVAQTLSQYKSPELEQNGQKMIQFPIVPLKKVMTQTVSTSSSHSNKKQLNFIQNVKKVSNKYEICQFQIIKHLGQGKFGSVSLARHKQSNFYCALKKMSKNYEDEAIIEQLVRQIKIQSFLDHPNIVQLYNFFVDEENIFLTLQLCCSGNLYTHLKKQGKFCQEKVKSIIRQVCHAIQYLHEHDIIHRDIKPQNILVHENVIKLCDFGWSVLSPLSRGTLCGTPIYASPQLVQKKQYDSKIDIWNIGILTYELLYGRVPFQIRTEQDLQKVVDQQIYFPKSIQISELAKDFIRQCLNKNPQYRISIVKLLDHQFIYQEGKSNHFK